MKFVASVPYSEPPLDFAKALQGTDHVSVSRHGPQRRVQLNMTAECLSIVRSKLPEFVVVEPALEFQTSDR